MINSNNYRGNGLLINAKSAKIGIAKENTNHDYKQVVALYVLLGGYNSNGRNIPLEKYEALKENFFDVITETADLL